MVNRTIAQLLRAIIKKNLKSLEGCLPFIEFAYNRVQHSTIKYSPFEIVYGFNPLSPLDLVPLPIGECVSIDGEKNAKLVKSIHEKVKEHIDKNNNLVASKRNFERRKVNFEAGDLVCVYL